MLFVQGASGVCGRAVDGLRPPYSAHVRHGERGAQVEGAKTAAGSTTGFSPLTSYARAEARALQDEIISSAGSKMQTKLLCYLLALPLFGRG
jgi:hypothetical protein